MLNKQPPPAANRYRPRGLHGLKEPQPKRGSVLWRTLKKGVPMFLGRRRRLFKPRPPKFLIDPDTRAKGSWDVLLAACVFYTTCVVPYRVCFQREATGNFAVLENVMDVGFFIDIILNFFTGVHLPTGDVSFDRRVIARAYLRGWFVIDLFSTFPFDKVAKLAHVSVNSGSAALLSAKLLRALKVLRLFKLARIRRLGKLVSRLEDAVYTNQSLLELLKLAFIMLFVAHLVACVWYAVGLISDTGDGTWITRAHYDDDSIPDLELLQYVGSMYWAIVTMTTIGYGDIVGQNNAERLVNIAVMAVGASFFGYVVGTISSLVTNLDVAAARYDERMTIIKEYIHSRSMPKHLSTRIRDHFEYYYQNRSVFDERKVLSRLPSALRNEMIHHVYSKLVSSIKYFEQCHESLVSDIVVAMKPFSVLKDEYVYVQHEIAAHVFFLLKGKISLIKTITGTGEERRLAKLVVGDHFGEMEVYDQEHGNGIRICSAVAKSYCELTFLSRKAISKIGDNWPEVLKHFKASAISASVIIKRRAAPPPSPAASALKNLVAKKMSAVALFKEEEEMAATIQKSSAMATKIMRDNKRKHRVAPITEDELATTSEASAHTQEISGDRTSVEPVSPVSATLTPIGTVFPSLRGKKIVLEALPSSPAIEKPHFNGTNLAATGATTTEKPAELPSEVISIAGSSSTTELLADISNSSTITANLQLTVDKADAVSKWRPTTIDTNDQPTGAPGVSKPPPETRRYSDNMKEATGASDTEGDVEHEQLSHMIAKIRDSAVARPKPNFQSERQMLKGTRVLHPQEPFILTWQFIVGIGILYSIIVVPLRLGFDYEATGSWYLLEFTIDGFFMFDILLNFRTAFFNDERLLIHDPRVIFWRYFKGWFMIDLVSTVPIDELVRGLAGGSSGNVKVFPTKLLRLLRVARLLKLVRLIKLSRVFGRVRDIVQLTPSMERLLKLLTIMMIFCHWNACLFHSVMLASESDEMDNWCEEVYFPMEETFVPCSSRIPLADRYVTALYWAFTTLTTVGYGDVKPSIYSIYELSTVIILIVIDATMFGYILSAVISLIRNLNPSDREYKLLMNEMKDYLRDSTASMRLCANVKTQYQHNIACTSLFPEQKIFEKLYPSLRYDLGRIVAGESLFAIPLITVMEDSFKGFVSYALFLLKPLSIRHGEKVCRSGGPGTEMFFLVEGECDLINSQTKVGRIIGENAVFEQYALMTQPEEIYRTVSTVTALSPKCILYSLAIQDFRKLEEVSPAVSTYFLSQLASVLMEDGMFTLSPPQKRNVQSVLRRGQHFRAVAEKTSRRPLLKDLGRVAMANLHARRGSEWSPDLLPKQLQLLDEADDVDQDEDAVSAAQLATNTSTNVAVGANMCTTADPQPELPSATSNRNERRMSTTASDPDDPMQHAVCSIHPEESVGES